MGPGVSLTRVVYVHGIGAQEASGEWADALAQRVWERAAARRVAVLQRTVTWGTDISEALAPVRMDLRTRGLRFSAFRSGLWEYGADALVYGGQRSVRSAVLTRVEREIMAAQTPVVIVAHSWGTVVACDALARLHATGPLPPVALVTLGSPLAITGTDFVPPPGFLWVNIADPLDPIGSPLNGVRGYVCEDLSVQTTPWLSRLRPVAGPLQAHTAYWKHERVVEAVVGLAERLAG